MPALRFLVRLELSVALHLGAVGEWWAARAARRLGRLVPAAAPGAPRGKFSGECSGVLKSEDTTTGGAV